MTIAPTPRNTLARTSLIVWGVGFAVFLAALGIGLLIMASAPSSVTAQLAPVFLAAYAAVIWVPLGITALVQAIIALTRAVPPKWPAIAVLALIVAPIVIGALLYATRVVIFAGS